MRVFIISSSEDLQVNAGGFEEYLYYIQQTPNHLR